MNLLRRSLAVFIAAGLVPGTAWSNPYGAQVIAGQASISRQGAVTSITNTPGAILQWQGFSIRAGETTRFIQQSASSSVLNRVVGQNPSQILGSLESNGRVFLINPNGILFGPGARVDVNGLVASTLAMSNADFLAGRLNFRAGDKAGTIVNQGQITTPAGGRVYLVAPDIENSGVITTPQGATLLAAGRQVSLVDAASPYVDVIVSAPADRALNVGEIVAHGGSIGVYGALINQRGRLDADSMVVGQNGRIVLKASGDTLLEAGSRTTARGAGAGGEIQILGERVALTGDAKVDASGNLGGGTVLVGGDYQGKNAAIQNAQQIYIGADAEIRVDAIESGDGGKAIVWSDGLTRVYGSISARGGEQSGNGGFVETSGKVLDMQGRVDTRAPNGRTGTLLLDPTNIFIANDLASAEATSMMIGTDASADSSGSPFSASGPVRDSLLTTGTLMAALELSSVVVSTANGSGSGDGFINVVDAVSWSAPNSLTLDAGAGVFGAGVITGRSLIVNATQGINLRTQIASFAATDTGSDTSIILVNSGALTLQNVTQTGIAAMGGINITSSGVMTVAGAVSTNAGALTLSSSAGVIQNGSVTSASGVISVSPPPVAVPLPPPAIVSQVINPTINTINTVIANAAQPTKPIGPPAPSVDAMRAAEAAARAAADAAARAAAEAVAIAVADAAANAAAAAATAAAMRAAAKAAEVAAEAMAAAQAAAKVAADVAANAAAYEAAQVAKATQLAASALTDSATVARAAADAAAKAAADTAAMKAKADADAQAALNAAVRAKSDADAKAALAEKAEADAKKDDKKDKKDDKKEVAATDKSGAKKEDAAKKMYCN